MSPQQLVTNADTKFQAAIAHFESEAKKLRTGRAHPSMLESVVVEAYGQPMPLIQVATVSAPEPQLLQISPFDPNNLQLISAAIRDNQSLGMNPSDDGRLIRVPIPPLTEERRQQIVKQLGEKVEEAMITMRGVRHDVFKDLDQAKKDKDISDDEHKRLQKQIDDQMAKHKAAIDALARAKESEIMTV
jgi:ribosome recycling factor